jgi:hypothetical protein
MEVEELIEHAETLAQRAQHDSSWGHATAGLEFLRTYAGPQSQFLQEAMNPSAGYVVSNNIVADVLRAFASYVRDGLHQAISPERQAQLRVVSDLLEQAQNLLNDPKTHPGAAAMLIGATLEEYLRTLVEAEDLSMGNQKPGLSTYASALYKAELIEKQDVKDITSWAGIRNAAAHGEWDQVDDPKRIRLMLEGVNLFQRRYKTGRPQ